MPRSFGSYQGQPDTFDNLQITVAVPESGTLAMTSLGVLALLGALSA